MTLGQPRDGADATRMLQLLRGRDHSVVSAVCVRSPDGREAVGHAISRVGFASLTDADIAAYVGGGEPFGKAGAYAIQGTAGAFATLRRGRLDTVVGLPVHTLRTLLGELGFPGRPDR